jgi:acetyl-CoA acetyltransferase
MAPFGMFSPPIMIAPLIQRYIHEFGTKPEHFAEIALVCRDNAQRNQRAVMAGGPLTLERLSPITHHCLAVTAV